MKKSTVVLLSILFAAVCVGILYSMNYTFDHCPGFRSIFGAASADGTVLGPLPMGDPGTIAKRNEAFGRLAMFLFSGITVLQVVALFVATLVISRIRKAADPVATKLKQLENADIFLDVPLYIGLFGTVSSFLVMTYSPTSSRLIAYSSTLIGIIFSLLLRLSLNYPLRKHLIAESEKCGGK